MQFLETPITYLKGVGPVRADLLKKELNIFTFHDLLTHYPFRYIDRSIIHRIIDLKSDMPYIQIKGILLKFEERGKKRAKRLIAYFKDESGTIELIWFKGIHWIKDGLKLGEEYIAFGKPTVYGGKINIAHPEMEIYNIGEVNLMSLQSVYSTTENLNSKGINSRIIRGLIKTLINSKDFKIEETLSNNLID